MLRFRGKDVLRISKYNMLMFIILGLLGLGDKRRLFMPTRPRFQGIGTFHLLYDFRDVVHIWYYHRSQPIFAE